MPIKIKDIIWRFLRNYIIRKTKHCGLIKTTNKRHTNEWFIYYY